MYCNPKINECFNLKIEIVKLYVYRKIKKDQFLRMKKKKRL